MFLALRRLPALLYILGVLLAYPPMYHCVVSDVRYRYPVLRLSLLAAGYFFQWLVDVLVEPREEFEQVLADGNHLTFWDGQK
jgi:hypothetical protein